MDIDILGGIGFWLFVVACTFHDEIVGWIKSRSKPTEEMSGTCMQNFTCRHTNDPIPCDECVDDCVQWHLGDSPLPGMLPYGTSLIAQYPGYADYYYVQEKGRNRHIKSGDYVPRIKE